MSQIRLRSVQNEKRKMFKTFLFLIQFGYSPKFAALSVLLVVRYQLEPKSTKGNIVHKVGGVVNQVSCRRGVPFYAISVQIFPRSFGCANFTQIDQILSM